MLSQLREISKDPYLFNPILSPLPPAPKKSTSAFRDSEEEEVKRFPFQVL